MIDFKACLFNASAAMTNFKYVLLLIAVLLFGFTFSRAEGGDIIVGDLGKRLDHYLTRITPYGFSGTLLVAKNGTIVLNKGYGLANRAEGIHNSSGTIFCAGSITKQFTAAAIMTLEMQGKLKTNEAMSTYLDGVPPDKFDITLQHLLTHTSGLVPDVGGDYDMVERDQTVRRILKLPLEFAPGERFAYSNVNYTLLAAIIENVSGQSYEAYLHDHLFKPAGMMWTGYRMPMWIERVVAHWYVGDKDNTNSLQRPFPYWNLIGNGGILTTTDDMYRWHAALLGETILSSSAKKKLFTPFLNNYAFGWDVLHTDQGRVIQHNGGSQLGNNAEIRRYIDSNVVTILFCNQFYEGKPLIDAVRRRIEEVVFGRTVTVPPEAGAAAPAALKRFAGAYKLPSGDALFVSIGENGLLVSAEGQEAASLLAFPDGGNLEMYKKLGTTSARILLAAIKGDYGPLGGVMENREKRIKAVRELIQQRLREEKKRTGDIRNVEVISILPSAMGDSAIDVCVQLRGARGNFFLRVIWRGERNIGIGPMEGARRVEFLFLPLTSAEFAGYDLAIAKDVRIKFDAGRGKAVAGLTVETHGQGVRARKISR